MAVQMAVAAGTNNPSGYDDRTMTFKNDSKLDAGIIAFAEQVKSEPTNTTAIYNLALAYRLKGQFDKSLLYWNKYIELNSTNDMAYKYRATVHNVLGNYEDAIEDFNKGIALNPNDAYSFANRGFSYNQEKNYRQALSDFNQALQIDPNNEDALNNLAWLRATCPTSSLRDSKEAVSLATKACETTKWRRWTCVDTFGTAYAADGDFDNAIKFEKMAAGMDGVAKNDLNELNNRLLLFQNHQPYQRK